MRIICGILSVLGFGWAWFALGTYAMMFVFIFEPKTDASVVEGLYWLTGCILATAGYWIWSGWIQRCFVGRYHWVAPSTFWLVSICQHAGWFYFLYLCDVLNGGFWLDQDFGPLFLWWNVGVIIISAIGFISELNTPAPKRKIDPHTVPDRPPAKRGSGTHDFV